MKPSEHTLQQACINWFRYQYPELRRCLFAIPNGGFRNKRTGKMLKDEGAMPGVSDIFLSIPSKAHHGFYIEMKYGNNQPTKDQVLFMEEMRRQGYRAEVVRSIDEFMSMIGDYFKH